jgi:hypothetical protein
MKMYNSEKFNAFHVDACSMEHAFYHIQIQEDASTFPQNDAYCGTHTAR